MKKIAILLLLLAIVPLEASALSRYDNNDVLSYVAMPLAVSAVCDIRGVQTDRVGQLVAYMDEANVAPTDFVDVFRYVPVALVMRSDNRPDFVEWVHGQVDRGVVGADLATAMEAQLRTYDDYVPARTYLNHRRYASDEYDYAYEPDYVPVVIRRHCERLIVDPLALIEMPLAVSRVCDLGLSYDRVGGLAVELNLGDVPALQFDEVMRYAPVALVDDGGYYGQPDFVQFVRTRRMGGVTGYPLVLAVDQQLRAYNVTPQIDLISPTYASQGYNQAYYVPPPVQNYVAPADPAFVPTVVQTRFASNVAPGGRTFGQQSPAVVAAPQVQRLLAAPGAAAVVASPAEARRELGRGNRAQREAPIASGPVPPVAVPGMIENRAAAIERRTGTPAGREFRGNGNGNGKERGRVASAPALPPMISSAPPREHGRGHEQPMSAPAAVAAPTSVPAPPHEHGRGHEQPMAAPAAVAAPASVPAPPREHGRGHAAAAPVAVAPAQAAVPAQPPVKEKEHGHGGPPPAAVAAPAAAPTPAATPALPAGPPGQEKKKGKGKDQ